MFAPGIISFQVITPAFPVASVNGTLRFVTLAVPVIVTVPVLIVNAFPTDAVLAVPETVTFPVPKTKGTFNPVILDVVDKVTVPIPNVNLVGLGFATEEVPATVKGPIVAVNLFFCATTVTLEADDIDDIAVSANEANPKSMVYAPGSVMLLPSIAAHSCIAW